MVVGFAAGDVGGDGPGEEGRRRRRQLLLLLLVVVVVVEEGLGVEQAVPEAGGADADGAADVGEVLLASHSYSLVVGVQRR